VALLWVDDQGQLLDLNTAAERLLDEPRAGATGRSIEQLLVPESLNGSAVMALRRALGGEPLAGIPQPLAVLARRPDGQQFAAAVTVTATPGDPHRFGLWVTPTAPTTGADAELVQRGELLRSAEQFAQLGSFDWKPQTGDMTWSANMRALFELPEGVEPTLQFVLDRIHPDDRERIRLVLEETRRTGLLPARRYRIVRDSGEVRHIRTTLVVSEAPDAGPGTRLVGVVEDETDRRRAGQYVLAHVAVADSLAEWDSLESWAERLLHNLSDALELRGGVFWVIQAGTFVPRATWSSRDLPHALPVPLNVPDRRISRLAQVARSQGPQSWIERSSDPRVASRRAADRAVPRGRLAFPILADTEALGVIELVADDDPAPTPELQRSLVSISHELGQFLVRRRGELAPPKLTAREIEILQLTAHGATGREIAETLVLSPATVKSHFEHVFTKLGVSDRAAAVAIALRDGLIN
jgi:DNA-binding NarL/FixJ family response regulator/PAS domain-containing protein